MVGATRVFKYCSNKDCPRTGILMAEAEFHKNEDRLASWCKQCRNKKSRDYHLANPEKEKRRRKKYNQAHPDAKRTQHRLKQYGLTKEGFDLLLSSQHNRCAICQKELTSSKDMHVDHSHRINESEYKKLLPKEKTKYIRGILCRFCNPMLGLAKDDISTLLAAIEYLKEAK